MNSVELIDRIQIEGQQILKRNGGVDVIEVKRERVAPFDDSLDTTLVHSCKIEHFNYPVNLSNCRINSIASCLD